MRIICSRPDNYTGEIGLCVYNVISFRVHPSNGEVTCVMADGEFLSIYTEKMYAIRIGEVLLEKGEVDIRKLNNVKISIAPPVHKVYSDQEFDVRVTNPWDFPGTY